MIINDQYVLLEKVMPEMVEGFNPVEIQDDFIYKGKVHKMPYATIHIGNHPLEKGDIVLFSAYSPDTHEVKIKDKVLKFVRTTDLLAVIEE